ncbi:MAG: DUF1236 domain-containing protein [Mesorhizobium sp.]|nr:DUF1236 domain-containing protein [Mesorhizobium sp.]MCO5161125.1 DUF1236 domain-containing protein [Mesorhizobium sp.]
MKRFNKLGFAAALLAGSALSVITVSAQETADPTKPRLQQNEKAPSAKSEAPGQKKLDGQAATEMAPGQKQTSGEVDSAAEAAPGQVKTEGQAEATGDTMKKTDGQADAAATAGEKKPDDKAATEFAPGQKQKTGQADAQDAAPGQQQKMGEADANDAAPGQMKQDQAAEQQPSDETTASIDISAEQKTEIRTIIREAKVEPVDVDIDLRVGVEVPRTVELHPLPPRFVEIVPEYRDYVFFVLADGRVVIVRPNTYEVVYILVV